MSWSMTNELKRQGQEGEDGKEREKKIEKRGTRDSFRRRVEEEKKKNS